MHNLDAVMFFFNSVEKWLRPDYLTTLIAVSSTLTRQSTNFHQK